MPPEKAAIRACSVGDSQKWENGHYAFLLLRSGASTTLTEYLTLAPPDKLRANGAGVNSADDFRSC